MKTYSSIMEVVALLLCRMAALVAASIVIVVLLLLIRTGYEVIDWQFLTHAWEHRDITKGGIVQAIAGSAILGFGVLVLSLPLGIGTAIFLTEYGRDSIFRRWVEVAIRNLAGVPSVVFGLFGLAFFVSLLSLGHSLIAAICTLAVMTLPWVITASTEALSGVPQQFRESSLALGATHWQTVRRIVLPAAIPGCLTGVIVSVARAMGETAPIILVGATFYMSNMPSSPFDRFMALPYHSFILATQHADPHASSYAAATGVILILLTLFLSSGAISARLFYRLRKVW